MSYYESHTWDGDGERHKRRRTRSGFLSCITYSGMDEDDKARMGELLDIWEQRMPRNRLRRRYYDGENVLRDLGISIPPPLRNIETVVGWPKKAVSALACRSRFDGYTATDDGVQDVLDNVVRTSKLKRKYRQAVESELIAGCDFVTLSKGGEGEPPAIITTHSAEDAAAVWSERLGRIAYGMVILDYTVEGYPVEAALYTDSHTVHMYEDESGFAYEYYPHSMGRPMMVAMAYNPTEDHPLGQSRITRAVRSITDSGVREALRTEISAEFYTSPQKYILGSEDALSDKTRWEAYIGNILTIEPNENGDIPQFGQLSQVSMSPHTEYMRALASRFSGETNVPISQLGIASDNPSSAEAIYAANEPLIIEAERLRDDNAESLTELALMAVATVQDVRPEDVPGQIMCNFTSPAMPSIVSQSDAMVKIASVVPEFAGTDVFWEQLGFAEDVRQKITRQMQANQSRQALISIMGGGAESGATGVIGQVSGDADGEQ